MLVRTFSIHFVRHWVAWRGEFPCIEEVNRLIESGQQLRPQIDLYRLHSDGTYHPYTLLAEFWNHEAGVVLRVDERSKTAVTVIRAGRKKGFRRVERECNQHAEARGARS